MTKPFSFDLLLAKVNAQIRRAYGKYATANQDNYTQGNTSFNPNGLVLHTLTEKSSLSKNEALLISLLLDHFQEVVSRQVILERIWDVEHFVEENTLNVNVSRLRKKLLTIGSNLAIQTVKGLGYKLDFK